MAHGDSYEAALSNAKKAIDLWIEFCYGSWSSCSRAEGHSADVCLSGYANSRFSDTYVLVMGFRADGAVHGRHDALPVLARGVHIIRTRFGRVIAVGEAGEICKSYCWLKSYLKQAALLETTARGVFRITERGRSVLLENPVRIDMKFLSVFPSTRLFVLVSVMPISIKMKFPGISSKSLQRSCLSPVTFKYGPRWQRICCHRLNQRRPKFSLNELSSICCSAWAMAERARMPVKSLAKVVMAELTASSRKTDSVWT